MKEFKFACPVCGQHISALPGTTGTQIECPTCFQKIIVPQERTDDTKLVLNASKAEKLRAPQTIAADEITRIPGTSKSPWVNAIVLLVVIGALGVGLYSMRDRFGVFKHGVTPPVESPDVSLLPTVENVVPTNSSWTLDARKAAIPAEPVAGRLGGKGSLLTRAMLQGGTLSLRQGQGSPPELMLVVPFPAKHGESLAGKKVLVEPNQPPPLPRIQLRWKNDQSKLETEAFKDGYLLKLEFGKVVNERLPGEIYIALPDAGKSFLAGRFVAEIRPPAAPKPKKPKKPARQVQIPATP